MNRCYSSGCRPKPIRVGKDGKSAYEIWAENQPEGADTSLEAYLEYMKGKDGQNGKDGQDGKDGIQSVAVKGPALIGDGSQDKPLEVPLSKQSGNLLEVRTDGLYYGQEAPPDLSYLYVDSENGSDSNKGTRASPLKTLRRAIDMTPSNQSNTIRLRAGGEYVMTGGTAKGCTRLIEVYDDPFIDGDKKPALSTDNPWYYWFSVAKLNRPIIRTHVNYNNTNGYADLANFKTSNGGSLIIAGCIVDLHADNDLDVDPPAPPGSLTEWRKGDLSAYRMDPGTTIQLKGCIIRRAATGIKGPLVASTLEGGYGTLQLLRCLVEGEGVLTRMGSGGVLNHSPNYGNNTSYWVSQDPENNATLVANTDAVLKDGTSVTGIARDADGKPRNVLSNVIL